MEQRAGRDPPRCLARHSSGSRWPTVAAAGDRSSSASPGPQSYAASRRSRRTSFFMTGAQTLQRAFLIMTATVATVAVVEEAPEGARAYATSMLALAGGFGFSISVIILPFADIGEQAWRIPFALGALDASCWRPRSVAGWPRPSATKHSRAPTSIGAGSEISATRGVRAAVPGPRRGRVPAEHLQRTLVAARRTSTSPMCTSYSNSGIALFRTVTTGLPGLFGLVLGGRLAEVRGRRSVAADRARRSRPPRRWSSFSWVAR